MPFIRRSNVPQEWLDEGDSLFKARLRQALSSPVLSPEQADRVKKALRAVGQPKVYDANSPPPPGAIQL